MLAGDPGIIAKLTAFQGQHIDGHAPLLSGLALNGYLAAGIRTDHEATSAAEAREKLSKGMAILIREGSVSKDLEALAEILDADTSAFVALCTDDRNPLDTQEEGHLDSSIRRLIARGCPLHHVYRAAVALGGPHLRAARPRPRRAGLPGGHGAARRSRSLQGGRGGVGRPAGAAGAVRGA